MSRTIHCKRTLMAKPKGELVEDIMCLEHNLDAMKQAFEIQYTNCMKMLADMNQLNDGLKASRGLAALGEERGDGT